jgi:ribosomal protein S21
MVKGNRKESRRLENYLNEIRRKLSYETGSTKKKQKAQPAAEANHQGA